ncbi:MAG: hypothetical protein ABIJ45_08995, partial [Candidatus Zixiibacteriota bacterium]
MIIVILTVFFFTSICNGDNNFPRYEHANLSAYIENIYLCGLDTKIGTGSSFFYKYNKYIFLVTAGHIFYRSNKLNGQIVYQLINPDTTLVSWQFKENQQIQLNKFYIDLKIIDSVRQIIHDKENDIAIIFFGIYKDSSKTFFTGMGVKSKNKTGGNMYWIDSTSSKSYDEVYIGQSIYIYGYPSDLSYGDNSQFELENGFYRSGIVSAKNKVDRNIILDCQVHGGNSGCPVFADLKNTEGNYQFYSLGMIIEKIRDKKTNENSGYSVAIPMDKIEELIKNEFITRIPESE